MDNDDFSQAQTRSMGLWRRIPKWIKITALVGAVGIPVISGGMKYNDAGYCQHIRTIFGTESVRCSTGWFFAGWGNSNAWPHEITIANTNDARGSGSSISQPYSVRLSDNWRGRITQVTRFQIPQDQAQFLKMARDFRSPERLISSSLRPAVEASLDSVANLYSMEQYYSGGERDSFKTEFSDTIAKGRAKVRQVEVTRQALEVNRAAPNDFTPAQDSSDVGSTEARQLRMEKVTDESGNVIRIPHDFQKYGVTVSSAILQNLDPDDSFEQQQNDRKQAASRRIIAREQRLEQEEQRLLAIQQGETNIAKRQAEAKVEQIQQTTEAETRKKLALIKADQMREEAGIIKETAAVKLETARLDAEAKQVSADAEAYAKRALIEADGALQAKLDAWVAAQKLWSEAAGKINVPQTVIGGGSGVSGSALNTVDSFMQMMMIKSAKNLAVDTSIDTPTAKK